MRKRSMMVLTGLASGVLCAGLFVGASFYESSAGGTPQESGESVREDASLPIRWENPDRIEAVADGLIFDARVIVPENFTSGVFRETRGVYQEYDYDGFFRTFAGDGAVEQEVEYQLPDRKGDKVTGRCFCMENGEMICLYPDLLAYYRKELNEQYAFVFWDEKLSKAMYNADRYSAEADLAGVSRREAFGALENLLLTAGLDCGEYKAQAYALDLETMKKEYGRLDEWDREGAMARYGWTIEDEAYALRLSQLAQGLPVLTGRVDPYSFLDESGAPIRAIYRKDGFSEIFVSDLFRFEYGEKEGRLLTAEEIRQKMVEKYDGLLSDYTVTVQEMRLCALACENGDGSCRIEPVWSVVCLASNDPNGRSFQTIFHAVTGSEIGAK